MEIRTEYDEQKDHIECFIAIVLMLSVIVIMAVLIGNNRMWSEYYGYNSFDFTVDAFIVMGVVWFIPFFWY